MRLKRDWGLITRMAAVFVGLGVLYVVFGTVLAWYFSEVVGVVVSFGVLLFIQFYWGHTIALKSMGGQRVSAEDYPELHNRVQRLAQQAGIPDPDVVVADAAMPNAFATGRSQSTAVVCVTTGLLDALDGEELDGVIAHELAHIKHRDMAVMTVASIISVMSFWIVRWGWLFDDGGGGGDGGDNPHLWVFILASLVVWVASILILRLLSRYREYAADRGAAAITGNPAALATALRKLDGQISEIPDEDLRSQGGAHALYVAPVETGRITRLVRTHPETEQRVDRLQEMIAEVETRD